MSTASASTMDLIVDFAAADGAVHDVVGGKGANLGRLVQQGFEVPPGFTVTTRSYREFLAADGLRDELRELLDQIDYDDPQQLEETTAAIRTKILSASVPDALAQRVTSALDDLAAEYVAVRSSGTAEDLGDASFAGMHDTYLDVKGAEELLDALRRCWASLFTARVASYRQTKGYDHLEASLAVVVQKMVPSEVSGVMFTGNPVTTATDELVINASWGLGEAIVQGIVTPDEFVVSHDDLGVLRKSMGTKCIQVIRDPARRSGTVEGDVPESDRDRYSLTDQQVRRLADLGRRVQEHYGGFPQDTEWALADDTFYLLQSRPITGVEFSWDQDVLSVADLEEDQDTIWTRAYGDEIFNGALTPLTYSVKMGGYESLTEDAYRVLGFNDLARVRRYRYYKACFYYNSNFEKETVKRCYQPVLRHQMLHLVPPEWHDEVLNAPFSWSTYLKMQLRIFTLDHVGGVKGMFKNLENWRTARLDEVRGLPSEELQKLSDGALKKYAERQCWLDEEYVRDIYTGGWIQFREAMSLLHWMMTNWYSGDSMQAFIGLITGVDEQTDTQKENIEMWKLSEMIRNSTELSSLIETHENEAFFDAAAASDEGQEFHAAYTSFVDKWPHRGHADRDIYYPRRCEDPGLDYRAFRMLLSGPSEDPDIREQTVQEERKRLHEAVCQDISLGAVGALKVELYKALYGLVQKLLVWRDNERQAPADLITFSIKQAYVELGQRLYERGDIAEKRDFYFLSKRELYELFEGRVANRDLVAAKIEARKRDFDRYYNKEWQPPMYIQHGTPVTLRDIGSPEYGVFRGIGTSRGTVTGVARVVKTLEEIGRVQKGEIMITNSTDPGWTPVFMMVKAIVAETGGMLAHFSCLSREYGLPAVQLESAMRLIPDGATIEVCGDTGIVTILQDAAESAQDLVAP